MMVHGRSRNKSWRCLRVQAQECFFEKAVHDHKSPAILAR